MRYHIVIYSVPDLYSARQIPFTDEEFDSELKPAEITEATHEFVEDLKKGPWTGEIRGQRTVADRIPCLYKRIPQHCPLDKCRSDKHCQSE